VLEADEALALLWEVLCIVTSTVVVEIAVKLVNVVDGRTVSVVVTGSGTGVMPSVVNSPLVSDERVNMADII
jgi:predicted Rossmann-fold nucleotide-binding protein